MKLRPILLCISILTTILAPSSAKSSVADVLAASNLAASASLTIADCPKCHTNIVNIINQEGKSHKSKITCLNCHQGHPPLKRDIIPKCSQCHTKQPHFQLQNCLKCHTDPHAPLRISLTHNITDECTTCHSSQIKQLTDNPSIHSTLACTACHTKHGFVPECFACHAPHYETMTLNDCLSCHQAHMPLVVSYGTDTPSEFCGACHPQAYKMLSESRAKHRSIPCVLCHETTHQAIPDCAKCHQQPHPQQMLDNFRFCKECHGIAHNLRFNQIDMMLEIRDAN